MKKILFRKLLSDCLVFFLIVLVCISLIIWVFQAVNFLDIMIEDGRDYLVYINYTLYNFPKIVSKVLPFSLFFGFLYILSKYEINNEMLIFWIFGVSKMSLVNFFLLFSLIILVFQIFITSIIIPKTQNASREILRDSNLNILVSLIKEKKFNDNIKGFTIYIEEKKKDGRLQNIYLKKQNENNFQITIAKKGLFKNTTSSNVLLLFDGETLNFTNNKTTSFKFSKTEYNLNFLESNTITTTKTQEMKTSLLIECLINLKNNNKNFKVIPNCEKKNLKSIYGELYKRIIIPFYIPVIMLLTTFLIAISNESSNFLKYRNLIFLFGFLILIISEIMLRLVKDNLVDNFFIIILPIILLTFFYSAYLYKFKNLDQ